MAAVCGWRQVYCPAPSAADRAAAFQHQRVAMPWARAPAPAVGAAAPPGAAVQTLAAQGAGAGSAAPGSTVTEEGGTAEAANGARAARAAAVAAAAAVPEVAWLVAQTDGFTVADLGHLGRAALYAAAKRRRQSRHAHRAAAAAATDATSALASAPTVSPTVSLAVRRCDYAAALAAVQPSAPLRVRRRYEAWRPPL